MNKDEFYLNLQNNKSDEYFDKISNKYKINKEFKYLFLTLVSVNPKDRYSIEEILISQWMKDITKAFDDKSKKLYDLETQVIKKFELIKIFRKTRNKKVYFINKNINMKDNYLLNLEITQKKVSLMLKMII